MTLKIFYNKSFDSISSIPLGSRFSVIVARRVYKKIGDYIIKQKNIKIIIMLEKYMFQYIKK